MKKLLFVLTFTMLSSICDAQFVVVESFKPEYFKNIPNISSKHEILNRALFPGVSSKEKVENIRKTFGSTQSNSDKLGKDFHKEYDVTSGMLRKHYVGFNSNMVVGREYINPYVFILKEFYSNDALKIKKTCTTFGFCIGKEYHYDRIGNLTKVIDHDEGYRVTAEAFLDYCRRQGFNLDQIDADAEDDNTIIARVKDDETGIPLWRIIYYRQPDFQILQDINGQTGQVFGRETLQYIFERPPQDVPE